MADAEDDLVARLAAVVEHAAPSVGLGPHVGERELGQIRSGSEESALDESYRHLAGCAACRARLSEVKSEAGIAVAAAVQRLEPRRTARSRALLRNLVWPAAAVTLLGLGYAWTQRPHAPDQLNVVQRAYAGVMGPHAGGANHENTNLELSFAAEAANFSAFVVPCDEAGKVLASPRWFEREGSGRAVVVLAPRTFSPHSGKAVGLVVWGSDDAVQRVAARVSELAASAPPSANEQTLAKLVTEHGTRMQRFPLAVP